MDDWVLQNPLIKNKLFKKTNFLAACVSWKAALVFGIIKGGIEVRSIANDRLVSLIPYPSEIISLAVSGDGSTFVILDNAGRVTLWNANTWFSCGEFNAPGAVRVAINSDGSLVGTVSKETITVRNQTTGADLFSIPNKGMQMFMKFGMDGKYVLYGGEHGFVVMKNLKTMQDYKCLFLNEITGIQEVAISPDNLVVVASSMNAVHVCFIEKQIRFEKLTSDSPHANWVTHLTISHDGQFLASADDDRIAIWHLRPKKLLEVSFSHTRPIVLLEFSLLNFKLLSMSREEKFQLLELSSYFSK